MNQPWVLNLDEPTLGIKPGGTNPGYYTWINPTLGIKTWRNQPWVLNLDEPTLGIKPG